MGNSCVENFVRDLELVSPFKAQIINQIRSFYRELSKDGSQIEERIIYGGVGFFIDGSHFGGAYPNKHHVNSVFGRGNELEDPKGLLQGKGKFRRHLQLFSVEELEEKDAQSFAKAIITLITTSSSNV